ncbi:hypothetical protein BG011_009021 [Mortierella polycephala]|uniref:Uncharacterized protein n=1 Tax=Mortierella polycephala TaxID=41804 RepID=A0A9P6Q907_9FUNG|nr:hypothetical protein BG011_009021 [Mortierella polycephala]
MGKSAKFFKRPTRKEKAVLSLTKGGSAETSLYDQATSSGTTGSRKNKKDILSATANPIISRNSSSSATAGGHPPKASLAYKMQLNGGIKQAVKDLESMENDNIVSEDEDMDTTASPQQQQQQQNKKSKEDLDKTKPRPDYVELMYGKRGGGNKRKTFMPKPALIK